MLLLLHMWLLAFFGGFFLNLNNVYIFTCIFMYNIHVCMCVYTHLYTVDIYMYIHLEMEDSKQPKKNQKNLCGLFFNLASEVTTIHSAAVYLWPRKGL